MCKVLKVSRSSYYAWLIRPESRRARENRRLLVKIKAIHKRSRNTYGSPRVHRELIAKGEACNRKRIARLMSDADIRAKQKRRFVVTTDSKHNLPVAANLLHRQFDVEMPNRVWVSDITYIPTGEGWLYLATVMDLYSKQIVGWSMEKSLESALVKDALSMALTKRRPTVGLIHHSDRGKQYASGEYQRMLMSNGIIPSMSRKGNCWDNAPMESFFHTLKTELVHHKRYQTRREANRDIFEYIEVFYNRQRLHSSLGYNTPAEYERAARAA